MARPKKRKKLEKHVVQVRRRREEREAVPVDPVKADHLRVQGGLRSSHCSRARKGKHLIMRDRADTGKCRYCEMPFCLCNLCRKLLDA